MTNLITEATAANKTSGRKGKRPKKAPAAKPAARVAPNKGKAGNPAPLAKKAAKATKPARGAKKARRSKARSRMTKAPLPSRADIKEIEAEIELENAYVRWNEATAPSAKKALKPAKPTSKTATILDLLKQQEGVTLKEIMAATNWQAHSVRGFISAVVGKKMGLTVASAKNEQRQFPVRRWRAGG